MTWASSAISALNAKVAASTELQPLESAVSSISLPSVPGRASAEVPAVAYRRKGSGTFAGKKSGRTMTLDDALARSAAANPVTATDERVIVSERKVSLGIVQKWHLLTITKHTGLPENLMMLGAELSAMKFYRSDDSGLESQLSTEIIYCLGYGAKPEQVINFYQNYIWELVAKVCRGIRPEQAVQLAAAHAEWYRGSMAKQTQSITGLNAGAIQLVQSYAQGSAQRSPGQHLGGITGMLFDVGAAIAAPIAGFGSFWTGNSVSHEDSDGNKTTVKGSPTIQQKVPATSSMLNGGRTELEPGEVPLDDGDSTEASV